MAGGRRVGSAAYASAAKAGGLMTTQSEPQFEVVAIRYSGDAEELRYAGPAQHAVDEAAWIARQRGEHGAVSVWVQGEGRIIWAAGEKARALAAQGIEIERGGKTHAPLSQTTHTGAEIPVPTRGEFIDNLKKTVRGHD